MTSDAGEPLYINGARVPFTFWPENQLRYGPIHAANPWQCLLSFLGDDGGSRRCRAYIEQARDFHDASKSVSVTTMLLTLFYSYMNLAKAFLLCRDAIPDPEILDHRGPWSSSSTAGTQRRRRAGGCGPESLNPPPATTTQLTPDPGPTAPHHPATPPSDMRPPRT